MSRGRAFKRAAVSALVLSGALVLLLVGRALAVGDIEAPAAVPAPASLAPDVAAHLADAIRVPTVSHEDPAENDPTAFERLGEVLERNYPLAHQQLELTRFAGGARLYRWPGRSRDAPLLLVAHMDVVPVEPGTEGQWEHEAFAGELADGYLWGRGAMDDKLGVVGTLEAVESLLTEGFAPARDVYLAFGHDEEVGGRAGAAKIAEHLRAAGVRPGLVLDEGGAIVEGALPGISEPVALVGIAEKGYLSLRLSVELEGGHSSMPAAEGSIDLLSAALVRIKAAPLPARLELAPRAMLEALAPATDLGTRLVARNLWLLEGVLLQVMSGKPGPAATIRTTTAMTIFNAGTKDNVLPSRAEATLNFRVLPGDDEASIRAHLVEAIDDERVQIETVASWPASPTSDPAAPEFERLSKLIAESFELRLVAPYLVVGATDARHYADLSDAVFRFLPIHFHGDDDRKRMHGSNERISVDDARRAVWFYRRVIESFAGSDESGDVDGP